MEVKSFQIMLIDVTFFIFNIFEGSAKCSQMTMKKY